MAHDIETLRAQATHLGITFSGNTGADTLEKKIAAHHNDASIALLGDNEPLPEIVPTKKPAFKAGPPSLAELQTMNVRDIDPKDQVLIRKVVRAKALILRRVRITNLDPNDAELQGAVVTVMNKYTGKVSKFVPFGDGSENGYHIPQIILNQLITQKFVLRKQKKGGQFGVKTYKTTMIPKFNIEILPDLTKEELNALAMRQAAAQSIQQD